MLWVKEHVLVRNLFLKNQSSVSNFYSIIDNIDYKNKFAFEAINDFSKNNKIEVLNNVKEEIVKIHNIKTLKRVIK